MIDDDKTGSEPMGQRLRRMRREAGLSQEELGARLGITPGTISRVETGRMSLNLDTVYRWFQACGYELESIRVGTGEQAASLAVAVAALPSDQLNDAIRLVRAWSFLSERQRGKILGILEANDL